MCKLGVSLQNVNEAPTQTTAINRVKTACMTAIQWERQASIIGVASAALVTRWMKIISVQVSSSNTTNSRNCSSRNRFSSRSSSSNNTSSMPSAAAAEEVCRPTLKFWSCTVNKHNFLYYLPSMTDYKIHIHLYVYVGGTQHTSLNDPCAFVRCSIPI